MENDKAKEAAIYNLYNGDIIELDEDWAKVIHYLQTGELISKVDHPRVTEIIQTLSDKSMGKCYDKLIYEEKKRKGMLLPLKGLQSPPPVINRFFIQLPTDCNLNCSFCNSLKTIPCLVCSNEKSEKNIENFNYMRFLPRILDLKPINLILHGGNPFLLENKLNNLVNQCKYLSESTQIWVVTHWKHLFSKIKENKRNLNENVNCYIVVPASDFNEHEDNLKNFRYILDYLKNRLQSFVAVIVLDSDNNIERLKEEIMKFNPQGFYVSHIYRKSNFREFNNNHFVRVNVETFWHNFYHHPCLYGTLALTSNGKILPCPNMKKEILADVMNDSEAFERIFGDREIDKYWNLNLGKIEKCKECIFRYGCFECRAVELKLTNNLSGKFLCSKGEY